MNFEDMRGLDALPPPTQQQLDMLEDITETKPGWREPRTEAALALLTDYRRMLQFVKHVTEYYHGHKCSDDRCPYFMAQDILLDRSLLKPEKATPRHDD